MRPEPICRSASSPLDRWGASSQTLGMVIAQIVLAFALYGALGFALWRRNAEPTGAGRVNAGATRVLRFVGAAYVAVFAAGALILLAMLVS